jgi:hypothetical protein
MRRAAPLLAAAAALRGVAPCSTPCAGCPPCPSAPEKCEPCPAGCEPPALKAERMPLAAAYPPRGMGCYEDHAAWLDANDAHHGPRLMHCGVWGCSGSHGCGGASVGPNCPADECPAWPASTPKATSCSDTQMTLETCIQTCLAWDPRFVYAGVNYGWECWCDTVLDTSQCRATAEDCSKPCPGDPSQSCGGLWRVNVYQIRPDLALEIDHTSWVFVGVLCCAAVAYLVGGMMAGRRRGGAHRASSRGLGASRPAHAAMLFHCMFTLFQLVSPDRLSVDCCASQRHTHTTRGCWSCSG